jgi:hypothetical protein
VCEQPLLFNSSALQCTIGAADVGRCTVSVSLNNQSSTQNVTLDRLCGEGRFGLPGEPCGPCPSNAQCVALFPVPLPLPGFYPVSLAEFIACVPQVACAGVDVEEVRALVAQLRQGPGANASFLDLSLTQFYASDRNASVWRERHACGCAARCLWVCSVCWGVVWRVCWGVVWRVWCGDVALGPISGDRPPPPVSHVAWCPCMHHAAGVPGRRLPGVVVVVFECVVLQVHHRFVSMMRPQLGTPWHSRLPACC